MVLATLDGGLVFETYLDALFVAGPELNVVLEVGPGGLTGPIIDPITSCAGSTEDPQIRFPGVSSDPGRQASRLRTTIASSSASTSTRRQNACQHLQTEEGTDARATRGAS